MNADSQLADVDRKILKLLLNSDGRISTRELSRQLGISSSTAQRRRKTIENNYLVRSYSIDPLKFGYRKIDLLIYTESGETMNIGKSLLNLENVTHAARTIGEHTIDLRIGVFVKDNSELLNLLESVKGMEGVRDVVWTEVVETIGRKSPLSRISS